jgi:hypothetical protein
VLRDTQQNILSTFAIPANAPLTTGWNNAASIVGDKEFYLPAGKYVIELFFVNAGRGVDGSATANNYPAGPDVDILILERTGDMEPPVVTPQPGIWPLPFIPTTTGGAVNRQRGWSTTGFVCPESGFVGKDLPVAVLRSATHLVMELAGQPSTSATRTVQVNIMTESLDWSQAEPLLNGVNGVFKPEIGPFGALVFDFENLVFTQGPNAYKALQNMKTRGRILIGYFSYGWEELNVMRSYLITASSVTTVPELQPADLLHAWVNNGLLHITGLTAGELVSIYSVSGTLVYRSIATGEQANIPLRAQGMYIVRAGVRAGVRTVKVVSCQRKIAYSLRYLLNIPILTQRVTTTPQPLRSQYQC